MNQDGSCSHANVKGNCTLELIRPFRLHWQTSWIHCKCALCSIIECNMKREWNRSRTDGKNKNKKKTTANNKRHSMFLFACLVARSLTSVRCVNEVFCAWVSLPIEIYLDWWGLFDNVTNPNWVESASERTSKWVNVYMSLLKAQQIVYKDTMLNKFTKATDRKRDARWCRQTSYECGV